MRYLKIAAKPQYFFNLFSKRSNFSHKNAAEPQYLGKMSSIMRTRIVRKYNIFTEFFKYSKIYT